MAKFTFLLPAYKAKFLNQMLNSIAHQSFDDFKVLISDDCSPEDIESVVRPYLCDGRFSYRRNDKNIGQTNLVGHWNEMVNICETEFLILASDDDVYHPTYLESINNLIEKYSSVNLFRARVQRVDEYGNCLIKEGPMEEVFDQIHFVHQCYRNDFIPCVSNYCYRTEALKLCGGFQVYPLGWFSDDATNILMSKNGCAITKEVLFDFRWSSNSITFSKPTHIQSYQKLDATILYDAFFRMIIAQLNCLQEPLIKEQIYLFHKNKMQEMLAPYTNECSLSKFLYYCKTLKSKTDLDVKPLVFCYLRQLIKRNKKDDPAN